MADMYDNICSSSPPPPPSSSRTGPALESDEISIFLHHLFQAASASSSSYSSSSCMSDRGKQTHAFSSLAPLFSSSSQAASSTGFSHVNALLEDQRRSCQPAPFSDSDCPLRDRTSTAESSAPLESSSGLIFSSSGLFFPPDVKDSAGNMSSSVGPADSDAITGSVRGKNDLDDYDCESEEVHEVLQGQSKAVPPRISSKRSRAAEVHNLSEKRRRSRINEKMKALQKLIPNSNKTDKASMLDEAIEYLKQLQLQVQMLSMRNGLSLHPMYVPGMLETPQMHQTRASFCEGNESMSMNLGTGIVPLDQEATQTAFGLSSQCTPLHQTITIPSMNNISNSETSFGMDSSLQAHLGTLQLCTSSKEICREGTLPRQQQLNASHSAGNTTASLPFDTRASHLEDSDSLAACMLHKERSPDLIFNNVDGNGLLHHLNGRRTG